MKLQCLDRKDGQRLAHLMVFKKLLGHNPNLWDKAMHLQGWGALSYLEEASVTAPPPTQALQYRK